MQHWLIQQPCMLFTNSSVAMMDNYPKTLVIAKHMFLETIYKVKYSDHNQYRLQLYNSLCFRRTVQKKKKRMLLLDLKRCSCKINTFFLLFYSVTFLQQMLSDHVREWGNVTKRQLLNPVHERQLLNPIHERQLLNPIHEALSIS